VSKVMDFRHFGVVAQLVCEGQLCAKNSGRWFLKTAPAFTFAIHYRFAIRTKSPIPRSGRKAAISLG
jgi:hypothetical protein